MTKSHFPPALVALLLVSGSLFISWSFAVPVFEGPDEPSHWQYILYVHQHGEPPFYGVTYAEANQPPLYYILSAPFAAASAIPRAVTWVDDRGFTHSAGTNLYAHSLQDYVLYAPLYAMRLIAIGFSLLAVLFCYWIGLEASGRPMTGLLTAGLVAFLPQFTYRGMNISNDALLVLVCAMATFWLVRLIKRGFRWRDGIAAAVSMGLAFLTRINAAILPAPFALALISQNGSWRTRFGRLLTLAVAAAIVLPWLVENQVQYGDPLAMRTLTTVVAGSFARPKSITSPYFVTEFPQALFQSFVGQFGFLMDVRLPDLLYAAFGLLFLVAGLGVGRRMIRQSGDRKMLLLLLLIPVLTLGTVVYLNLTFSIPFGRYMFPALPAIAALLVLGLEGLPGWSDDLALAILVELFLVNVFILERIVIPAHAFGG